MSNLVQIEFFHVSRTKPQTLEVILAECSEILVDSVMAAQTGIEPRSRLKTVVRFYDTDGVLTSLALQSKRYDTQNARILNEFATAGWFRRKIMNRQSKHLAAKSLALRKKCLQSAVAELRKSIVAKNIIAIEKRDYTFRLAQKNELDEIYSSAKGAYDAWLFVFEPNDLLSQNNKTVAHAM